MRSILPRHEQTHVPDNGLVRGLVHSYIQHLAGRSLTAAGDSNSNSNSCRISPLAPSVPYLYVSCLWCCCRSTWHLLPPYCCFNAPRIPPFFIEADKLTSRTTQPGTTEKCTATRSIPGTGYTSTCTWCRNYDPLGINTRYMYKVQEGNTAVVLLVVTKQLWSLLEQPSDSAQSLRSEESGGAGTEER